MKEAAPDSRYIFIRSAQEMRRPATTVTPNYYAVV